jgi:hypothetical protein
VSCYQIAKVLYVGIYEKPDADESFDVQLPSFDFSIHL